MEAAKKRLPKYERTTREQLQCYVSFCNEHKEMQTGKNCPKRPDAIKKLWEELATRLNSMRGPTRTPTKWKETLCVWRSQLKTRARRAKAEALATGGGPRRKSMDDFEQQAIATFGAAAVDGVAGIPTFGIQLSAEDQVMQSSSVEERFFESMNDDVEEELELPTMPTENQEKNDSVDCNANVVQSSAVRDVLPKAKPEEIYGLVLESLKRRQESDERMLNTLAAIAQNMEKITENLCTLTKAIENIKK